MAKDLPRRTPPKRLTREEKKAETRAKIIYSAQELFARNGYEGTSIDQIAADAGFSRGAFYANFDNKEAVMRELIDGGFEGDLAGIEAFSSATVGAPLSAAGYAELARRFYDDPSNTLWMLEFRLAAVRHPELRESYREQFSRLRGAVERIIADTFDDLPDDQKRHAQKFADVFIAILSGVSLIKVLDPEEIDSSLFSETYEALVAGIRRVVEEG